MEKSEGPFGPSPTTSKTLVNQTSFLMPLRGIGTTHFQGRVSRHYRPQTLSVDR
jgi:hypothetical protein